MNWISYSWLGFFCLAVSTPGLAQETPSSKTEQMTSVVMPGPSPVAKDRLKQLKRPEGFEVSVIAKCLKNARLIAVSDKGYVYISRREEGDVLVLRDPLSSEKNKPVVVAHRPQMHGLAMAAGGA